MPKRKKSYKRFQDLVKKRWNKNKEENNGNHGGNLQKHIIRHHKDKLDILCHEREKTNSSLQLRKNKKEANLLERPITEQVKKLCVRLAEYGEPITGYKELQNILHLVPVSSSTSSLSTPKPVPSASASTAPDPNAENNESVFEREESLEIKKEEEEVDFEPKFEHIELEYDESNQSVLETISNSSPLIDHDAAGSSQAVISPVEQNTSQPTNGATYSSTYVIEEQHQRSALEEESMDAENEYSALECRKREHLRRLEIMEKEHEMKLEIMRIEKETAEYNRELARRRLSEFLESKQCHGHASAKGFGRKRNNPNGRPTIENTVRLNNVGSHLPMTIKTYRRCAYCSTKTKEKRSNMICEKCNIALCKSCFKPFHNAS